LPWLKYGRDVGEDPDEPSTSGFSTPSGRTWLENLLDRLPSRQRTRDERDLLLRVFVGTDWRHGLTYEPRPMEIGRTACDDSGGYGSPFLAFERFKEASGDGDFVGACSALSEEQVRRFLDAESGPAKGQLESPCVQLRDAVLAQKGLPAIGGLSRTNHLRNTQVNGSRAAAELDDDGPLFRHVRFVQERGDWKIAGVDLEVDEETLLAAMPRTRVDVPYELKYLRNDGDVFSAGNSLFGIGLLKLDVMSTNYTNWLDIGLTAGLMTAWGGGLYEGGKTYGYSLLLNTNLGRSIVRWNGGGFGPTVGGDLLYVHQWTGNWGTAIAGPSLGVQLDFGSTALDLLRVSFVYWNHIGNAEWLPGLYLSYAASW
jgi:hypothetical protein